MRYTDLEIELANEFRLTPLQIRGMIAAYDSICRMASVKNIKQLEQTILEIRAGNGFIYKELPERIKSITKALLLKFGRIDGFYSPFMKQKKIREFIKGLISKKIQPSDYYFDGILTLRHLKREIIKDSTCEIVTYRA